jgi:hypothetical protein
MSQQTFRREKLMAAAADEQLAQLSRQLSKQSLGWVDTVLSEVMSRLMSASTSITEWLRQAAYDQPFITLLLAGQAGYLFARLGRRRARH